MSAGDPLKTIWDALEAGGFGPHGQAWDFRARCPAHDGDNPGSLRVSPGADGRALVHCHGHRCEAQAITLALGLDVRDLFPAGHRHARRLREHRASRADFTGPARDAVDMLYAVDRLGQDWRVELILRCPACGDGRALFVASTFHDSFMSCPEGCTVEKAAQTLAGSLQDGRRAA